jgi:hypothetical protein
VSLKKYYSLIILALILSGLAIDIENDRLYGVTYQLPPPPIRMLVITDISDPTNPVEEGWISLGLTPEDIDVNGNYAYVAGGG